MNADHAGKTRPTTREFQDGHSTEAVAYCTQSAIDQWMGFKNIDSGLGSLTQLCTISTKFHDEFNDFFTIPGHALTVHVARERNKTPFGKTDSAASRMIVEASATMDDKNSRAAARGSIQSEKTGQRSIAIAFCYVTCSLPRSPDFPNFAAYLRNAGVTEKTLDYAHNDDPTLPEEGVRHNHNGIYNSR
jgi:hypothetical protein